jgi:hypothetical protein
MPPESFAFYYYQSASADSFTIYYEEDHVEGVLPDDFFLAEPLHQLQQSNHARVA